MLALLAWLMLSLGGFSGPTQIEQDARPAPAGDAAFASPQRITAPRVYLSRNAYCQTVSNGCVTCYRDDGAVECTQASASCVPRPTFRCNRF